VCFANALSPDILLLLLLQVPLDQLTTPSAGLFPEFEHFEVFAGQRPDEPYRCGSAQTV
jgi:hypothetical protein